MRSMRNTCSQPVHSLVAEAASRLAPPSPLSRLAARPGRLLAALLAATSLAACGSWSSSKAPDARAQDVACPQPAKITAPQLYGPWQVELPEAGMRGEVRLSRHPEFSESLRAHIRFGPVQSIASGDADNGHFDLDESHDGKTVTATWSGEIVPGSCGREIRGQWHDLDNNLKSRFVLRRPAVASGQW